MQITFDLYRVSDNWNIANGVLFVATVNGERIPCGITSEALYYALDSAGPADDLRTAERHKETIEAIARRKIERGELVPRNIAPPTDMAKHCVILETSDFPPASRPSH